jgi:hypothetical protein
MRKFPIRENRRLITRPTDGVNPGSPGRAPSDPRERVIQSPPVAYPREFSVILFILLVAVCAYLLLVGKLSGASFVSSIFVCAAAVAVMHNLDVVQRLQLKGGKMEATAEFERIRNEVYAKAEEVRHLAEQVAGMIAESVATSNRWGGSGDPDPILQLARYRENLRKTLSDMGTTKERSDEILQPFAKWIPFDLRSAILGSALDLERQKGMSGVQMNEFSAKLSKILEGQPPLEALGRGVDFLHGAGLDSTKLQQQIQRYRTFLVEDRVMPGLPRD